MKDSGCNIAIRIRKSCKFITIRHANIDTRFCWRKYTAQDGICMIIGKIFESVSDDPDIEWLAIDAIVIRTQAQVAGARIKRVALKPRLSGDREAGSTPKSMP